MDNAGDEPLIVQLWLDLEKRFGGNRVGVVFAFSTVTVSLDGTLCERLKRSKIFLKTRYTDRVCVSSLCLSR